VRALGAPDGSTEEVSYEIKAIIEMKFTNEFITSVHDGKGDSFRKRYREMVILFLGDPQFVTRQNRAYA
jgi:chromosomal replication initiation ATPase DnaA